MVPLVKFNKHENIKLKIFGMQYITEETLITKIEWATKYGDNL